MQKEKTEDNNTGAETEKPREWTKKEMEEAEPLPLPEIEDEDENSKKKKKSGK